MALILPQAAILGIRLAYASGRFSDSLAFRGISEGDMAAGGRKALELLRRYGCHCYVLPLLDGRCRFRTADGRQHAVDGAWDMILAFPPCTHLAVSGARYFKEKRRDGRQQRGIDFFLRFVRADCGRVAIENPVGIMSTVYRRPDQIIQPYEYGHAERKRTCLWLKGLPPLVPTRVVRPELHICANGLADSRWHYDTYSLPPKRRAKERSKTFPGIAQAMAEQWGGAV